MRGVVVGVVVLSVVGIAGPTILCVYVFKLL